MLRVGVRAIHLGAARTISANPQIQIRWTSQLEGRRDQAPDGGSDNFAGVRAVAGFSKSAHAKWKGRSKPKQPNTSSIEDSFESQPKATPKIRLRKRQKSNTLPIESVPTSSPKATSKSKQTQIRHPETVVLYTKDYIRSNYELPTATQYGPFVESPFEYVNLLGESGIIVGKTREELKRKITRGKTMLQITLRVKVGDGKVWTSKGHGATVKAADEAAHLHTLCELHKSGELSQVLSGVTQYLDPGQPRLRLEANAKKDIIDYAARHDCLPVFSFHKMSRLGQSRKTTFRAHASIPDLGLNGYGRGSAISASILAACISLKHAAEARHRESGAGTLLVKDYTNLTTHSAEKFLMFYCRNQRLESSFKTNNSKPNQTGGDWVTEVTLTEATLSDDTGLSIMKSNWKPISDSEAWPAVSIGEDDQQRTYEGIPMMSKSDAETVGYLAAAIALKKESAYLWEKFVKEMRRGNGDLLKHLSPIDIGIDQETVEIMEDTLQQAAAVGTQNEISPKSEDDQERRPQVSHQLSEKAIEKKSEELVQRLGHYETNPSLTELRRLRLELPMTQHREKVMKMINGNDVCVVVGATGSGKTTQVPQLILDDLIRQGKGGSCNIICTQPRRIAAVSVAQRVAVERNECLRQSIGYSVRFDSRPPELGGSVHYLTTGILLKQMQDAQNETLDGISHIIVDEVHERDLNNDFLLVVLKNLLEDRKKAGKPAIKIILMSATINTSLFCKYFGDGHSNKMCPYIEVPGRTFPVTSHYLDEIYSELRNTYSKNDALDLYNRQSQDYITRELESRSQSLVYPTAVDDLEDETSDKAMINWKSTGFVSEDGEIDVAVNREDKVTPVGLMGVMVAHLLKTTTDGSILVFLPGLQEIIDLEKQLKQTRPLGIDFANNPDYQVYILHSSLPQMQQDVFAKVAPGQRKIILATNIAETSVTIPDVVYVVDSSKQRETQYDRTRRIMSLVSAWTAKSNARQRAGRAGRVQHGHYYTMATKARYESFEISQKPEILRTDLQSLCLQIKSMGVKDVRAFLNSAIEPPGQSAVETAMDELRSLKALDEDENLTSLGRYLSALPLAPSIAKMVILGAIFKCLDPMLILAASQTARSPFLRPLDQRREADRCKERWSLGTGSDHAAFINVFQEWRRLKRSGKGSWQPERQFSYVNFLHNDTLLTIARTADQILDILQSTGLVDSSSQAANGMAEQYGSASENINSNSHALRIALATAGFYPNIAVRRKGGSPRFLRTASENEVAIFPYSLAAPKTVDGTAYGKISDQTAAPPGSLFTFCDKTQADDQGIFLRSVSRTNPLAVFLFGGRSTIDGLVFTVDDWIPFYVRKREKFLLQKFSGLLEEFLERTFGRLRSSKENRRLERGPSSIAKHFLDQDKVRDPLVKGVVKALESCAPPSALASRRTKERPHFYGDSKERVNTELLQEFYSAYRSERDAVPGMRRDEMHFPVDNRDGGAWSKLRETGSGSQRGSTLEQDLREELAPRTEQFSSPRSRARGARVKPRSTVLDLLQKWNK